MPESYRYHSSIKSSVSDELINTLLLRPLAGIIVRILYNTPVTPNQITLSSIIFGLTAALLYAFGACGTIALGGLFITLKDILDSADGQLARAKGLYSRAGRFLDSIGDFFVNAAVFSAIGFFLLKETGNGVFALLAFLGFVGITLRVSYHVFYQVSFLQLDGMYGKNRIVEDIMDEDRRGDPLALQLQRIFLFLYGWQDRLMMKLDSWSRGGENGEEFQRRWHSDAIGLRISGFIGMGTELFLLMICSLFEQLELYLWLNLTVMNGVILTSIIYRRLLLRKRIRVRKR